MGCVLTVFRAEARRRWASWLALAILVAVVAGTVLAGVSAGKRTASAFPHFVSRYGVDATVYGYPVIPSSLSRLPEVAQISTMPFYLNSNGTTNGQTVPAGDFNVLGLPSSHIGNTMKLLSGRLPTAPDDALVGLSMQQAFGLRIGSVVTVLMYDTKEAQYVVSVNGFPPAHGPTMNFRVVGIEASTQDFPTGTPSYSLYTSRAFARGIGTRIGRGAEASVRLVHGAADLPRFQVAVNHIYTSGFVYLLSQDASSAAIQGSIHPQAVGWWIFALLAGLAGLALVGQALSRQSLIERESFPTLSALGFRPAQVFQLGIMRSGAIGIAGAVCAVAIAYAVSPLTPVGEARAAEPSSGFFFDVAVFCLGAVATALVVMLLGAPAAWRASQIRATQARESHQVPAGASRVVDAVARTGAPPSILVGTRHALERGKGRSSVPVATALVGTVVAVAALVATAVFGASLSNLLATPRLYGVNWQVDLGGINGYAVKSIVGDIVHQPGIDRVTDGISEKFVSVNGVPVQAVMVNVAKGPMVFSLVDGRYPSGDSEIALGSKTLAAAGAHVGSRVRLSIITGNNKTSTRPFTVVGTVALPTSFNSGGLGVGAVLRLHAVEATLCPTGSKAPSCIAKLSHQLLNNGSWGIAIRTVPGAAGLAEAHRLDRRYASELNVHVVPADLVNFGQAVNFPALLGVTLCLFGAATLAHLLFVSVVRRRREVALLKVLGFLRRQVAASVSWQSTTVALIGIAVGVPVGIAIGHAVWRLFATNLGAVPVTVVPVGLVVLLIGGVVVAANLLAVAPAAIASRLHPAEALREA